MALEAGTRFGSYEVAESIGAGGMGEVYRARDTNLKRYVALKVLPPAFVEDSDRLARFQREAEILASLNHPNIAQVYGLEKAEGQTAIVMELVEGPTLAEKISEGPIPTDEAMEIALQVVGALEAAHDRQIVHRDLKPANVKVKDDGTVKVLDFGISKPIDPSDISGGSPLKTTPAVTRTGVILGTAPYMSPEQAQGKFVDQRTDIWAFGCLLFEMLTGQPAFAGENVMAILARVIDRDTDLSSIPNSISSSVRHTISLCLRKDVRKRFSDIRDVRLALQGEFESELPHDASAVSLSPMRRFGLPAGITVLVASLTGISVWLSMLPRPSQEPEPEPVNRFEYLIPDDIEFFNTPYPVLALSPDGRHFAIRGDSGIYLRRMGELEARLIPGTDDGTVWQPMFSPNGQSVAYMATYGASFGDLVSIAIAGGASVIVAADITSPFGGSWAADGTLLWGERGGIFRVSEDGGTPDLAIPAEEGETLDGARLLPDGDSVLSTSIREGNLDAAEIVVASLTTGERTVVWRGGYDARYLPTGHLVYAFEDTLFGIAFDLDTLSVFGSPVPLVQGLVRGVDRTVSNYGVSDEGTLVYLTGLGSGQEELSLVWVDRAGNETATAMPPCTCALMNLALSPDGTRAAFVIEAADNNLERDIWIWSFESETLTPLTFKPGWELGPIWTQDSDRIVYVSSNEGILARAADGTGSIETLLDEPSIRSQDARFLSLDADGNVLFAMNGDIHVLNVADGTASPLLAESYEEFMPAVSRDGRWIAYTSNETGQPEVYVRPYPDVDSGKWQVSSGGGYWGRWSPDGSRLYFSFSDYMEVEVETDASFRRQTPEMLFPETFDDRYYDSLDISADGDRFLVLKWVFDDETTQQPRVIIVENWIEELKRLVPTD